VRPLYVRLRALVSARLPYITYTRIWPAQCREKLYWTRGKMENRAYTTNMDART
jgi:hypothetical protein